MKWLGRCVLVQALALMCAFCSSCDGDGDADGDGDGDADSDGDGDGDGDGDADSDGDGDGDGDGDADTDSDADSLPPDTIIPADRRTVWQGNVGVSGGIPERPTQRNCRTEDGAVGDGATDDTAAIRSCVENTPEGETAYLPAGEYLISGSITIDHGVTLRGDGPSSTTLRATSGSDNAMVAFRGEDSGMDPFVAVTGGHSLGSTTLTLADASGVTAGDYLVMVQNNDSSTTSVTIQGTGDGGCGWCGFSLCSNDENQPCDWDGLCSGGTCSVRGQLALGQIVRVESVSGDDVELETPLNFTYAASAHPRATRLPPMLEHAGVEGIFFDQSTDSSIGYHVSFSHCASCWSRDIESNYAINRHIISTYGYRNEIRDSAFHGSDHYGQDHGYAIELGQYTTGTLIENNIFDNVVLTVNIERGSNGTVVAYNYSHHIEYTNDPDAQLADWVTHGAHPYMNLFEGNVGHKAGHDNYWGSSSHHTWLRNYLSAPEEEYSSQRNVVLIDSDTWFVNFVGNVLGRSDYTYTGYELTGVTDSSCYYGSAEIYRLGYYSGSGDCEWDDGDDPNVAATLLRHGNYDEFNHDVVWDPAIESRTIPESYYLSHRPDWWPASCRWPAIGPDLDPMVADIPAKRRFDTGSEECD